MADITKIQQVKMPEMALIFLIMVTVVFRSLNMHIDAGFSSESAGVIVLSFRL